MNTFTKNLWTIFIANAQYFWENKEPIFSPAQKREYQIISVDNEGVQIQRLGPKFSTENIGYATFSTCVNRIKEMQPIIPKRGIYNNVLVESSIVRLMPMLDWESGNKSVVVLDIFPGPEEEIEHFSPRRIEKSLVEIAIRKGQQKLRQQLILLYSGHCAVTDCAVENVLHACHIIPYIETGVCLSIDAILLRSDIHDLFDADLLAIHPYTLAVHVHPALMKTEYGHLHDKRIQDRVDGRSIRKEGLSIRWKRFQESILKYEKI